VSCGTRSTVAELRARVAFVPRGLSTQRYHQYYTARVDSVGKHSAGVAMFCYLIDPTCRQQVLAAALTHDLAEAVVGDLPAPTKRSLSLSARTEFAKLEDDVLEQAGFAQVLEPSEQRLLKIGDYLDGLWFCIEERRRGNHELDLVAVTYVTYLQDLMLASERDEWHVTASILVSHAADTRKEVNNV